jgi:hypothetical protein
MVRTAVSPRYSKNHCRSLRHCGTALRQNRGILYTAYAAATAHPYGTAATAICLRHLINIKNSLLVYIKSNLDIVRFSTRSLRESL